MNAPAMRYVFGPVPSRRLGRSLGIDPVPLKTCNFSCVYCQLGRTKRLTERRKAFFNVADIFSEVATALSHQKDDGIDWLTFVGSGETTLFSRLGWLIRFVKSLSDLPVAVITNGSLLSLPKVREELMAADAVLPSLDAGTESLYRSINRPRRGLAFDDHVGGMTEFRKMYQGELWVEVMLLRGVNDSEVALRNIAAVLQRVAPDEIHLVTPTRPPAESWVEPPDGEGLERAVETLGQVAKVLPPVDVEVAPDVGGEMEDAIMSIVSRHPLHDAELRTILARWMQRRVQEILTGLVERGDITVVERFGKRFWCAADLEFSTRDASQIPPTEILTPETLLESRP